jgi:VanZ family protein
MKRFVLAGLFLAVIVLVVALADNSEGQFTFAWLRAIPGGDKVGHFLLMGGLAFVCNYAFKLRRIIIFRRAVLLGSLVVFALAALEEFSQCFIRTRTFDWLDLTCDALGIWCFGQLAVRCLRAPDA